MRILDESLSVELPVLSRKEAKQKSQFVYYRQVLNTPTSIASEENVCVSDKSSGKKDEEGGRIEGISVKLDSSVIKCIETKIVRRDSHGFAFILYE